MLFKEEGMVLEASLGSQPFFFFTTPKQFVTLFLEVILTIIIFSSTKNKKMLQQILNWGRNSHIKFQMYFTLNNMKQHLKQKHDFIVVTEKSHVAALKKAGVKCVLIEDNWYKGAKVLCR